jgi:molybdenum cofactor synthesis domain-containing protein
MPTPRALVITVSDRASAGMYADKGGPLIIDALHGVGFEADGPIVVPDGPPVEVALRSGLEAAYDVIITSGGTGLGPRDHTPQMTALVLDYEVPGIAEAIRAEALIAVPTAVLGRGIAGVAGRTLIVNLPGSTSAVRDGMAVLAPILQHAVAQLAGSNHGEDGHHHHHDPDHHDPNPDHHDPDHHG